jgi:hypothetical protein
MDGDLALGVAVGGRVTPDLFDDEPALLEDPQGRPVAGGGGGDERTLGDSDDNTVDVLHGGPGADWFLAHRKGKNQDQVVGQTGGEVVTGI